MAPWTPSMPWPSGTPGGAAAPAWGGYVRFWLRAAIAAGRGFHMGPDPADRLDGGNVLGGGGDTIPMPGGGGDRLWVDLTCDAMSVDISMGGSAGQGIFSKVDAATLTVELFDPNREYDPLNRSGKYAYAGRSRLVPGIPVEAFAEVVDPDTGIALRYVIFTGTTDTWAEDWTPNPQQRVATMTATDATKIWARLDRPEQNPVGQGDTVQQRIHRIVDFYDWPGDVVDPPGGSAVRLQSTTLAQPGWELLNRTVDDELGAVYLTPEGRLRWLNRATWDSAAPPRILLGCGDLGLPGLPAHDVLTDATPANLDSQMRNDVRAARSGGAEQRAFSQSSINRFGAYEFRRTDLGLADNAAAATWATRVVELYAFPQYGIADVTMQPGFDPESWDVWAPVLDWELFTDIVRIRWAPPDLPPEHLVDGIMRVVGLDHRITRKAWEVTWQLVAARPILYSGSIFTLGPHANDRLDTSFVMG